MGKHGALMTIERIGGIRVSRINRTFLRFFGVILGVTLSVLAGCASSGPQRQSSDLQMLSPENQPQQLYRNRVQPAPGQTIRAEVPEKMSSRELEELGDTYFLNGNLNMAFVNYDKSLRADPSKTKVLYKKGLLFLARDLNEEAAGEFKSVLNRDPKFSLAYEGLGRAFFQMKHYKDAEHNFRKAVELDSSLWKSYNFLGNLYDLQGNYELAQREYRTGISVKPDKGLLYHNLGVSYLLSARYEKAIAAFYAAIDRGFSDKRTYNNLGICYSKLGKYAEAFRAFEKVGGRRCAYNNLGVIYLTLGENEKAVDCFKKAIASSPKFYWKASQNLEKAKMSSATSDLSNRHIN
jgi:tetratricopeptide (TPR) repeat protein